MCSPGGSFCSTPSRSISNDGSDPSLARRSWAWRRKEREESRIDQSARNSGPNECGRSFSTVVDHDAPDTETECTATPNDAGVESCNGRDDDCDGGVDEDVVAPLEACERSNDQGTCRGDWACTGEGGWVCSALEPDWTACGHRYLPCGQHPFRPVLSLAGTIDTGFSVPSYTCFLFEIVVYFNHR